MRALPWLPLLCLGLAGCQPFYAAAGVFTGVNVAALVTTGRTVPDLVYSGVTGRDCSAVRLERGQSYCIAPDHVVVPPFCTHSLGTPDCWAHPERLANDPRALVDTPAATSEQIASRAHRWPDW